MNFSGELVSEKLLIVKINATTRQQELAWRQTISSPLLGILSALSEPDVSRFYLMDVFKGIIVGLICGAYCIIKLCVKSHATSRR